MPTAARCGLVTFVSASIAIGAPVTPSSHAADAYPTHAELIDACERIARSAGDACTMTLIGASREGRDIPALELARDGDVDPSERPALLLVANIDGEHLLGSVVALRVAERLLAPGDEHAAAVTTFLEQHTIYIVPRVNPDAAERFFADVRDERRRNMRPDDADRDMQMDEDPPNDLDGDGLITMMRVYDPERQPTLMPDPDDPRLDKKADRDAGEHPLYTLHSEGIDDDDDDAVNEDALGGVDLNRNFMHEYQEHEDGVGPHQVSEPESLALLQYVLGHQNIAIALTYGRHDNLCKTPDGKQKNAAGAPRHLHEKDVGVYKHVGERFRELTGLEDVPQPASDGAFYAWAYAQFGVPSFATPLWGRPEPKQDDEEAAAGGEPGDSGAGEAGEPSDDGEQKDADAVDDAGLTPSGIGDISLETLEELRENAEARGVEVTDEMVANLTPEMVEGFAAQAGIVIRRVGHTGEDAANGGKKKKKGKKGESEDAKWLAYSDTLEDDGGFVAWTEFDHPQFGRVEIGGWAPYFKVNPPPSAVEEIADEQLAFVLDLAERFPRVTLAEPKIKRLGQGLYEIKTALVNDGYLPAGTAMAAQNRRARPYVVRLDLPLEQVIAGPRIHRSWSIPGSGGRDALRWIVEAPDDSELEITVYSEKYGSADVVVTLTDNQDNGAGS